MRICNLHIERKPSYADINPNLLAGTVQLEGEEGKIEVVLSNSTVAAIFALVKSDVIRVAENNARKADHAIEEAQSEMKLIEEKSNDTVE